MSDCKTVLKSVSPEAGAAVNAVGRQLGPEYNVSDVDIQLCSFQWIFIKPGMAASGNQQGRMF
jgi:hypothetical protein